MTAGEIDINDQDKSKSAGVLYPAAQLGIGDDGQLTLNLLQNPWRLGNIIDWKGTAAKTSGRPGRLYSRSELAQWNF